MTLCASLYGQLELTSAEASEMAGIESFIEELNPGLMMGDDGCLDYLDMSEILSFGDDYKTSLADPSSLQEDSSDHLPHSLFQHRCSNGSGGGEVHEGVMFQQDSVKVEQEIDDKLFTRQQLKQLKTHRQQLPDTQDIHSLQQHTFQQHDIHQGNNFIKAEKIDSDISHRNQQLKQQHNNNHHHQQQLQQRDSYLKEQSFDNESAFLSFLSHASQYNEEMESEGAIDKEISDITNNDNINNNNNNNIDNITNDTNEDSDVITRVLSVCKQQNIKINPYDWSVDEVNRWFHWVIGKICGKLKNISSQNDKNNNSTNANKNNTSPLDNTKTTTTTTHSTTLESSATLPNNNNNDMSDYLNNTCSTFRGKNYSIPGSHLCGMSQESIVALFHELGEAVFIELEMWKNACCLLENIESTAYKGDGVFSPFETPTMCSDNDQQVFFSNLFHPFNASSKTQNSYVTSDAFSKQAIRPSTLPFFSNSQLSNSADPVLSQPSFFISPSPLDINDYNSTNNLPDFFFQPCIDMNTNSFSPPSSASPSSIHSDLYDPSYAPSNEPQHEPCVQTTRQGNQLWQFLKELLHQSKQYEGCIRWLDKQKGIFKIEDSIKVAKLWGERKNRPAMNYDKLSRSIRQYYKKGIIKKTTHSKRLVYQFCQRYL